MPPSAKIIIGCSLPHGLKITHPNPEDGRSVTLAGYHSNKLVTRSGAPAMMYATTEVETDLWEAWKLVYRGYKPLEQGLIFEARSVEEAGVKFTREHRKIKSGFEPLLPESHGIKTADKD